MGFVCNFAEEWPDSFMRTEEPDFVDMVVKRTGRRTAATSFNVRVATRLIKENNGKINES
jgi:hypothetical protein